jgi:hypothetical protein
VQSIAVPEGTSAILVLCDTNPARVTLDGTTPSTAGSRRPGQLHVVSHPY